MSDTTQTTKRTEEEYKLCELENNNLRNALAWAAQHMSETDRNELERCLNTTIEKGGVTSTDAEDQRQAMAQLLVKFVAHLEPLMLSPPAPSTRQPLWFAKLDGLLSSAREYEPKHPLMRRVGGHPNVFSPVRKGR